MRLEAYRPEYCAALSQLFYETVHTVNAKDYTPEQCRAWAPGEVDLAAWNRSFLAHDTLVALWEHEIVGFSDMDESGYLDRLYVHKDYQGRGIATALCDALENRCPAKQFTTHASVTARPFFERRGYQVLSEQQVERRGVLLTNYIMKKSGPA